MPKPSAKPLMMAFAAGDGRLNWFMGGQLLAVYLIFAVAFYFTPR
jgi:Ca2+/H+ antiporter